MNELVSIIMPSYNTAKFISKTIESVLEQTYKNWELLIVDDCSTDNTDEIVSKYDDDRIIYLKNKKNSGAAVSRNKALNVIGKISGVPDLNYDYARHSMATLAANKA